LASYLDGAVLLARWNQTSSAEVKKSMEDLVGVRVPLIGTILNYTDIKRGLFGARVAIETGALPKNPIEKMKIKLEKEIPKVQKRLTFLKWFLPS
jgi:Mrp family chromosome partitioning ATPase